MGVAKIHRGGRWDENKVQETSSRFDSQAYNVLVAASTNQPEPLSSPRDRYGFVYFLHFLLGAGMLWPYNTLVGVPGYLADVYSSDTIEFLVPMFLNYPSIIVLLLMVRYGNRISFSTRIIACFAIAGVCLGLSPLVTNTSLLSVDHSLIVFLSVVFFAGINTAVLQSSIFGFSSILPSDYTQAVMGGNGIAGLCVAGLSILTKAVYPSDSAGLRQSAIVFFMISASITFICTLVYYLIVRHPFTRHHMDKNDFSTESANSMADGASQPLLHNPLVDSPFHFREQAVHEVHAEKNVNVSSLDYWSIISKTLYIGSVTTSIFFVTFLVFPGLIAKFDSTMGLSSQWFSLILIAVFNFFDLVGRLLPGVYIMCGKDKLWVASLIRLLVYPMFVIRARELYFMSDFWIYGLTSFIAFTNGYFASLSMMSGASYVDPKEREAAGYIMTVFLMAGIMLGSHAAAFLHWIKIT